jgi:predicted transcriptional regulator
MRTVRSIRGDWMRIIARHAFPRKTPRGRIEALADALEISRRSCYAYVAEERRVPEEVEQRFIGLFGAVAEDGWRTIEMLRPHTNKAKKKRDAKPRGMSKERYQINREGWRGAAMHAATVLAQDALQHVIDWEQNTMTLGQSLMIDEKLDEQEARAKYPHGFDTLVADEDWVAVCKLCGLAGAVDDKLKEVNGLVFNVTCSTNSYKVAGE